MNIISRKKIAKRTRTQYHKGKLDCSAYGETLGLIDVDIDDRVYTLCLTPGECEQVIKHLKEFLKNKIDVFDDGDKYAE